MLKTDKFNKLVFYIFIKNIVTLFSQQKNENESIMMTYHFLEGLFQKYFQDFKKGHKKMSKIKNPKYFLKKDYD
jgi:hypothetical protein